MAASLDDYEASDVVINDVTGETFTLTEAFDLYQTDELPESYNILDVASELTTENFTKQQILSDAQSLEVDGAATVDQADTITARYGELTYAIEDSWANIEAAEEAILEDATAISLDAPVTVADAEGIINFAFDLTFNIEDTAANILAAGTDVTDAAESVTATAVEDALSVADYTALTDVAVLGEGVTYSLADSLENFVSADEGVVASAEEYSLTDATDAFEGLAVADILSQDAVDMLSGAANSGDYTYTIEDAADAFFSNGDVKEDLVDVLDDPESITVTTEVTADQRDSLDAINDNVDYDGGVEGGTYDLTINADTFTGTAGDDLFVAGVDVPDTTTTLQSQDVLDGQEGTDKLRVFATADDSDIVAAPELTDIENIEIRASTAATLDLSGASITGLETISINNNAANAVSAKIDDGTGVGIDLDNAGTGAITVAYNNSNDSTIEISSTTSGTTAGAATLTLNDAGTAAGATITGLSFVDITGENYVDVVPTGGGSTAGDLESISFAGTGSMDAGSPAATALTSVDATDLDGGLTIDVTATTGSTLNIQGSDADDDITADAKNDLTANLGAGDDVIDISASKGNIDADDSFDGEAGTNTVAIDVADTASVTSDIFTNFQVLSLAADAGGNLTGNIDFDDFMDSIEQLTIATAATGSLDIDNADGKAINLTQDLGAGHDLTINDDAANDVVNLNVDSSNNAFGSGTPSNLTSNAIEDLTINLTADGGNAISLAAISATGAETVDLSIADGETGAAVSLTGVAITSGDAVIDISADSVTVAGNINATGADSVDLNVTGDTFAATTLTSDASDISINLEGDANTIGAASLSAVTALEITSAGTGNSIGTLTAASLVDLTLNVNDGDFTTSNAAANTLMETVDINGAGNVHVTFDAAQTNLDTIDLQDYTGELANGALELSAITVGVTVELGALDGQNPVGTGGTAAGTGDIKLNGATNVLDNIVFNQNFNGSVAIQGFEPGGDVVDDNIDLSAFNISGGTSDLNIAGDNDDGGDTIITSATDAFDFEIVLTGTTPGALNSADFIF